MESEGGEHASCGITGAAPLPVALQRQGGAWATAFTSGPLPTGVSGPDQLVLGPGALPLTPAQTAALSSRHAHHLAAAPPSRAELIVPLRLRQQHPLRNRFRNRFCHQSSMIQQARLEHASSTHVTLPTAARIHKSNHASRCALSRQLFSCAGVMLTIPPFYDELALQPGMRLPTLATIALDDALLKRAPASPAAHPAGVSLSHTTHCCAIAALQLCTLVAPTPRVSRSPHASRRSRQADSARPCRKPVTAATMAELGRAGAAKAAPAPRKRKKKAPKAAAAVEAEGEGDGDGTPGDDGEARPAAISSPQPSLSARLCPLILVRSSLSARPCPPVPVRPLDPTHRPLKSRARARVCSPEHKLPLH